MTETLAQRTERMRREAATAAQAEARRQAALDTASAASRAPSPTAPAPSITPSSVAPAAAQPASAIVDPGAVRLAKERPMANQMQAPLKRTAVELSAPILWFDKSISKVELQEPSAADFFKIGEPEVFVGNGSSGSYVEVPEAIRAYLDKCLDVEGGSSFLAVLNMRDGRAIKKALLSFFQAEPEAAPA